MAHARSPAWTRTKANSVRNCCAAITLPGIERRAGYPLPHPSLSGGSRIRIDTSQPLSVLESNQRGMCLTGTRNSHQLPTEIELASTSEVMLLVLLCIRQ